jgi:hypothetical protein
MAGPEHLAWLSAKARTVLSPNATGIVAMDGGRMVGGVAYDLWTANSVFAHMAVDVPVAWRRLLPAVFQYPFRTHGIILGSIRADNTASLRMARHLGFRVIHRVADGYEQGVAMVLIEMRREECRWGVSHG